MMKFRLMNLNCRHISWFECWFEWPSFWYSSFGDGGYIEWGSRRLVYWWKR